VDLSPGQGRGHRRLKFYAELAEPLVEHLRQLIEYDTFKDKNGRTRREDLQAFGEDDLIPPEVELTLDDQRRLELFLSISRLRKPSDSGIMPLGDEIKTWEALFKTELTEQEIQMVLLLDAQYRTSMGKEIAAQSAATTTKSPDRNYDL
jgi:hypothetical protein